MKRGVIAFVGLICMVLFYVGVAHACVMESVGVMNRYAIKIPPGKCVEGVSGGKIFCVCKGLNGEIKVLKGKKCKNLPMVKIKIGGKK